MNEQIEEFTRLINGSYQKTAQGFLETASVCARARDGLNDKDLRKLVDKLVFNKATFSKFAAIGGDKRLYTDAVQQRLPASYSTLYELAKLDRVAWDEAESQRIVTPQLTRKDILAWVRGRITDDASNSNPSSARYLTQFEMPKSLPGKTRAKLEKELRRLAVEFGCKFSCPQDLQRQQRDQAYQASRKYLRDECVRSVANLKKRRLANLKGNAARASAWGFTEDEIVILPDASEERIRSVMNTVGTPEVFDRVLNEANDMVKLGPAEDHDPEYEAEMARSGVDEIITLETILRSKVAKKPNKKRSELANNAA